MSTFQNPRPDEVRINRGLVTFILFVLTIVAAVYTIRTGNRVLMIGLVAVPFVIMMMGRPRETFVLVLVLGATRIPVPGMSYTTLGLLPQVLLIGIFAIGFVMGRRPWGGEKLAERRPFFCLMVVTAVLMSAHGSGIRMLGSSTWGGMIYVLLFAGIAFYLAVNGLRLQGKQIRWIVWGSLLAGFIGAALKAKGFGAIEDDGGVGSTRLTWLLPVASVLFPLAFALKFKRYPWISALLLLICLGLIGLTGYRSRLIAFIMIAGAYGFFKARSKIKYVAFMGLMAVSIWVGVIAISPVLPLGLQRAVSFVPGAHVDYRTAQDAAGSIDWRLDIWTYCLEQSKQYLLIGRGSTFDVRETLTELGVNDIRLFSPWFAYQTRSYHSGPLTLLIDYGIPGLLAALWLTGIVLKRLWKAAQRVAAINTFEARYALFLCATMIWQWVAFYLVFGAMAGFANLIVSTAAAMVAAGSVLGIEQQKSESHPVAMKAI
jgi:hypothetical protein